MNPGKFRLHLKTIHREQINIPISYFENLKSNLSNSVEEIQNICQSRTKDNSTATILLS